MPVYAFLLIHRKYLCKARYFLTLDYPFMLLAAGMLHDFMSMMVFGQRLDFMILDTIFSLHNSVIL